MNIDIEKPFRFRMDLVETDDRLPSFRVQVVVDAEHCGHRVGYRGTLWFECSKWDEFVAGLDNVDDVGTSLVSMDRDFTYSIRLAHGEPTVWWGMKRGDKIDGKVEVVQVNLRFQIDEETLAQIRNHFTQFARWW